MVDFSGTWKNQNESKLELRQLPDNRIEGRFESGVGDDGREQWVEVSGYAVGDILTFHAAYPAYKTIVSWVGQHTSDNGVARIKTQWLHVSDIPDDQEQEWMWFTNRIGADDFVQA